MVTTILMCAIPTLLLGYFSFFAIYNCVYSVASMLPLRLKKVVPSPGASVAVVIVSFNEKVVLADTIAACERLSYPNKTIIVGDDSNDPATVDLLRGIAARKGCRETWLVDDPGNKVELHESDDFVLFHRLDNAGFKAGNLKAMEAYLKGRGFDYMYLLDADWRPQPDALERCLELIEADPGIAFVQTKRLSHYGKRDHLQRCLAINEEACYLVDMPGRQRFRDMILFTGCCTMFKLESLYAVGGFRPGHLTEDIDLSNRLYLAGHRGIYAEHVSNVGEVPPNYRAFRRQQERWATGSARTFKEYFSRVVGSSELGLRTKLGLLRQNAYFTGALAIEISMVWALLAVLIGALQHRVEPGATAWGESLPMLARVSFAVLLLSTISTVAPLIVATVKKRDWLNLLYIPLACWLSFSIVHTYAIANVKGLRNLAQSWFVTPKTNRKKGGGAVKGAWRIRILNFATLLILSFTYLLTYDTAGNSLVMVLVGIYGILWIPSMLIGSVAS